MILLCDDLFSFLTSKSPHTLCQVSDSWLFIRRHLTHPRSNRILTNIKNTSRSCFINRHQIRKSINLSRNPIFSEFCWEFMSIPSILIKRNVIQFNFIRKFIQSSCSNRLNFLKKKSFLMILKVKENRLSINKLKLKSMPLH